MVPKINNRGHSFKGVTAYLMHDKDALTDERVTWSETGNLHTNNVQKAALVMAYTDKNADILKRDFNGSLSGRKSEAGNVYHYSLSWAHGEDVDEKHQKTQALETLERLGLATHQYYMVSHSDTKHKHVHIVANLTHPETGKINAPSFDKRELQAYALEYEREHGLHCKKREENAERRERGENLKHQDTKQDYSRKITRAYYASDTGKAFIHALREEGLELAKARRGNSVVIVDDKGDIQKLSRQLDIEAKGKLKTAAIKAKLSDIDHEALKDASELSGNIKAELEQKNISYDRDADEIKQQKALADAAEKAAPEQIKTEDKAAALLKAQQAKESAAQRKLDRTEKQERYAAYQKHIDEKTATSRKTWEIEDLTKKRDEAAGDLSKVNSAWSRLFSEKKFNQAYDHHQDMEKRLAERLTRFKTDIEAFNENRPEWVQKRELEKHGFVSDERQAESRQERAKIEAEAQKAEKQNVLLEEATSSAEAARSLQQTVTDKPPRQKAELSRVHPLAKEQEGKEAAATKQEQEKVNEQHLMAENTKEHPEHEISEPSTETARIKAEFEEVARVQDEKQQEQEQEQEQERGGGWSVSYDDENRQETPEFEDEDQRRIWEELRQHEQNLEQERDEGLER